MIANASNSAPDFDASPPRVGSASGRVGAVSADACQAFAALLGIAPACDPAADPRVEAGEAFADLLGAMPADDPAAQMQADAGVMLRLLQDPMGRQLGTPGRMFDGAGGSASAGGKALPPGGAGLPDAAAPGAAPPDDEPGLARLLGMVRALHGLPALAGDEPGPGPARLAEPLVRILNEGRLEPTVQFPDANAPSPPAMSSASSALSAAAGTLSPAIPIPMPPNRPEWAEAVGQRVLWMISAKSQHAQLRLNPPELGPVEVRVRLDDDGLRLSFAANNAGVREALESAAPRLREMLQAEGLQLGQLDIDQRHAARDQQGRADNDTQPLQAEGGQADDDAAAHPPAPAVGAGLVDLFV